MHVYGCFHAHDCGDLKYFAENLNTVRMIKKNLKRVTEVSWNALQYNHDWTMQEDNEPKHWRRLCTQYCYFRLIYNRFQSNIPRGRFCDICGKFRCQDIIGKARDWSFEKTAAITKQYIFYNYNIFPNKRYLHFKIRKRYFWTHCI